MFQARIINILNKIHLLIIFTLMKNQILLKIDELDPYLDLVEVIVVYVFLEIENSSVKLKFLFLELV